MEEKKSTEELLAAACLFFRTNALAEAGKPENQGRNTRLNGRSLDAALDEIVPLTIDEEPTLSSPRRLRRTTLERLMMGTASSNANPNSTSAPPMERRGISSRGGDAVPSPMQRRPSVCRGADNGFASAPPLSRGAAQHPNTTSSTDALSPSPPQGPSPTMAAASPARFRRSITLQDVADSRADGRATAPLMRRGGPRPNAELPQSLPELDRLSSASTSAPPQHGVRRQSFVFENSSSIESPRSSRRPSSEKPSTVESPRGSRRPSSENPRSRRSSSEPQDEVGTESLRSGYSADTDASSPRSSHESTLSNEETEETPSGRIWDVAKKAATKLVSSRAAEGPPGASPPTPRAPRLASDGRTAARSVAEAVRAASKAAKEQEFKQSEVGKAISLFESYKKGNPSPGNSELTPRTVAAM